jgi:hypothetical protein
MDKEMTEEPDLPGRLPQEESEAETPETDSHLSSSEIPTSDMEVHHHPQLEHKAKPWKEYLLEGLMIFVAVMLGFIAENIREGITNREHVKELVSQLVQDLKDDTSKLNEVYNGESKIFNANEELSDLLKQSPQENNATLLQSLIINSHNLWLFYPSAGARAAIKNEIHLKQFSSSEMIGLIAGYEAHIDLLRTVEEITLQYQRMYIDPFLVQHFTGPSLDSAFNKSPGARAEIRKLSPEDLTQLGADMSLIKINTKELLTNNRRLFTDASNLLHYVKNQFNISDE